MARSLRFKKRKSSGSGPLLIFGIIWTAFSSIFVVVGLRSSFNESKVQGWDEVPCQIESFEITASMDEDPPFRPEVLFFYDHGGRNREGTKLWQKKKGVDDYEDLAELREELWSDLEVTCRVNPDDSDETVLIMDQGGLWSGLGFAAFGGGFVLVGVGMIFAVIKGKKATKAVSAGKNEEMGGLLGCGFFGIFAVAGLGILFGLVVPRAVTYFKMKSWVETPAEVIWSQVQAHSGDDGTTYSVDVFYKYEVDGREFRSNRWAVMGGSSSGRSGKQEVVDVHPPGSGLTCYVDPEEPWRAVVRRGLGWWALFALFPLPFVAIGLGGLWYTFIRKPKKVGSAVTADSGNGDGKKSGVPRVATSKSHRRKRIFRFLGAVLMASFWNGAIWVFLGNIWEGWQKGRPEWFLILFMIPFVLVGIVLIVLVFCRLVAIFSPVYELRWDNERPAPGDRLKVSWKRLGGGERPRRVTVWLIGQEEATYQRGSSTSTARSIFHEAKLFETETPMMMSGGSCDLVIPADAVPSFAGEHNKLRWFVKLVADVPWRPDVNDEHELEVGNPEGIES